MWGNLKLRNLKSGIQCTHQLMFLLHVLAIKDHLPAAHEIIHKAALTLSML
jgi:hypothetical protein